MSFDTEFLVSMTCQDCVDNVDSVIKVIDGIEQFTIDLPSKRVNIHGTASPALIAQRLQSTGRSAIVRGLGSSDGAAVCILEKHGVLQSTMNVFGLVRMVEVSSELLLCDLTLKGLPPGRYRASVHVAGDLRQGLESAGPIWDRGALGELLLDESGYGQVLLEKADIRIWELIGRALSVEAIDLNKVAVIGVIARSAGAWENTKTVCTCSGQNVWDERQDLLQIGATL